MLLTLGTTELRHVHQAGIFHLRNHLSVWFSTCSIGLHKDPSGTSESLGCVLHLFIMVTQNIFFFAMYDNLLFEITWSLPGLPWWLRGKESTCDTEDIGDLGSILGWGRSPGEGYGNPLQYSCLENPMDKGTWWATVHRITKSQTWLKQMSSNYLGPKRKLVHSNIWCKKL